ncbi:MAG: MaoC/PaaZ C-terminal domain-containing protein [Acidimicrobiia bacterium]
MSLEEVIGRRYGPYPWRVGREKVAEFIAATGDLPERWRDEAPPGLAAAALFAAAPRFFSDPTVVPFTRVLIHAEQRFHWFQQLRHGAELSVVGRADSVRARRGLNFVAFTVTVAAGQDPVVESRSRFIMADAPSGAQQSEERALQPVRLKDTDDVPRSVPLPAAGGSMPDLHKSASRADLVRYAGATLDWNPIHWDHDSAIGAGLGGLVVHGLLMASWAMQAATRAVSSPAPLLEGRFRFLRPLAAGAACVVRSSVTGLGDGTADLRATVAGGGEDKMEAVLKARVG